MTTKKTIIVTEGEVRAARLQIKLEARLGRESSPAIIALANARPIPTRTDQEESISLMPRYTVDLPDQAADC